MATIKKLELLKAMKTILREYKKRIHHTRLDRCALCVFYHKDNYFDSHEKHECILCPMFVFLKDNDSYPCMERKCEPVNCWGYGSAEEDEIKKVIEFYTQAIAVVETMTYKELNEKKAFKFLVKIDRNIAKKYDIL
jgi:hypothetical protein